MRAPLEAKVYLPVVAQLISAGVVGAGYRVLVAFHLLHLTDPQVVALVALGAALSPVLGGLVGFQAPHTARPDLGEEPGDRETVVVG